MTVTNNDISTNTQQLQPLQSYIFLADSIGIIDPSVKGVDHIQQPPPANNPHHTSLHLSKYT
jgi:hypothetical protein